MTIHNSLKSEAISAPIGSRPGAGLSTWQFLRRASQALNAEDPVAYRYLLLLRFAVANMMAFALVGAAAAQGWIGTLLTAQGSGFTVAIIAVFATGLLWTGRRALQISRELNQVKHFERYPLTAAPAYMRRIADCKGDSRAILASTLKLRLAARIAPVRHIANSLVLLGLIGTVIGFIVALSGVNPETASDVSAIGPMISTLINGMSIALYTTLVGSLLNLWLMVNVRLLEGGTVKLLTATVELGERHANA